MNQDIRTYINRIKNQGKRAYADHYWRSRMCDMDGPDHNNFHISIMAAQAVRMNIDALMPMAKQDHDDQDNLDLIEMFMD